MYIWMKILIVWNIDFVSKLVIYSKRYLLVVFLLEGGLDRNILFIC